MAANLATRFAGLCRAPRGAQNPELAGEFDGGGGGDGDDGGGGDDDGGRRTSSDANLKLEYVRNKNCSLTHLLYYIQIIHIYIHQKGIETA